MQLSQSEWIAVAILAGFLIYLSIKGKLAAYWTLLTGGAAASSSTAAASSTASGAVNSAASAVAGVAGAAAGAAVPALPGVTSGTVTQGGQTTQQYFPNIPGVNLSNPMSMVTF
jgi:hypothetical protein